MKKFHLVAAAIASVTLATVSNAQALDINPVPNSGNGSVYIVTFAEPGLLYNTGQNRAYAATAPQSTGTRKLNAQSNAASEYRNYLKIQQNNYISAIAAKAGRAVQVSQRYDVTLNGIALRLTEAEAASIASIPGIESVKAEKIYEINTDAGPGFIGAPAIWTGSGTPSRIGTRGQGVVIGVFDSGANQDHPSFANDASCGFTAANPKLVAAKDCNQSGCVGGNPEDVAAIASGHGVHTSSTAAGNSLTPPLNVNGIDLRFPISGVAPCAKIISYKTCTNFCPDSAILAAINASIVDGVDVVNFSVSGGTDPWNDNDRDFLDMLNADILVSASAGNTRAAPNPNDIATGAVNHRGPWVMTVANSTHDRVITNPVSLVGSLQNVPSQASSVAFSTTITAGVASAVSLGNEFGCTDSGGFAAGSMTGKLALIQRGPPAPGVACTFAEKINNASAAGAIGVVVYDRTTGVPINMAVDATTIPSLFIRQAAGYALRDFLNTTPNALMTVIAPSIRVTSTAVADVLNASSLTGPNIIGPTTVGTGCSPTVICNTYVGTDTTKPDITGPGTNIYAAVSDVSGQFGFLTGTSMSAPHLAGSAALIRAVHPTWTPTEVKSALMLTAVAPGRKPDEVTAWNNDDVGNGRNELRNAALAGFVMDETFAKFRDANPAVTTNQNAVRQLNTPSMRNTQMVGSYVFTRTLRNTRTIPTNWTAVTTGAPAGSTVTVAPSSFSFNGSLTQTQVITVTVQMTAATTTPKFGDVRFVGRDATVFELFKNGFEDPASIPDVRMTLTVQGTL